MLRKGNRIRSKNKAARSRSLLFFLSGLVSSFHFAVSSPPEASGNFRPAAAGPTRNQFYFVV
jgi:hypothetical protein